MTTLDAVADAIVRMPRTEGPRDSHINLLKATGYMDHRGEITVEDLYRRLVADPELVDLWETWSADNRGTPAWYFSARGGGQFEVGHIDRMGTTTERLMFDDPARGCAEYVRREIDSIAATIDMWSRP